MSGLATAQYDVSLNGQGYLLVEESYKERSQQPFVARFSTGDPSLGDLSFWQFVGQTSFAGGQGQDVLSDVTKIKGSVGWDFRDGKPRLSMGHSTFGGGGAAPAANSPTAPSFASTYYKRQKAVAFGSSGTNDIVTLIGSGNSASATQLDRVGLATQEDWVYQTSAADGVIWSRPQAGTYLVTSNGDRLLFYTVNAAAGNPIAPAQNIQVVGLSDAKVLVPLSANSIMIITQTYSPGASALVWVVTFDNAAWTISTKLATTIPADNQYISGVSAVDSNGTVYVASVPYLLTVASSTQAPLSSVIYAFSSTDLLSTSGPKLTYEYRMNNFLVGGLVSSAGIVYAMGAIRKSSTKQNQAIIVATTSEIVWESPYNYISNTPDNIIIHYFQQNPNEAYFFARNYLLNYDSLFRFKLGRVDEIWCKPKTAAGTIDSFCPFFSAERFYYISKATGEIFESLPARGALDSSGTSAILELSAYAGNTPLITKMPYSVTVEISEAMSGSDVITVSINDTTLGTIAAADGTSKTFTISSDLSSASFSIKLTCSRTVAWEGYLKQVLLRYIPVQFKKKMWGFGVRATKALKLIDGRKETATATTLFSAIKTAWSSNTPITFIDIDGVSHTVIVTEYDRRVPLIDRRGGDNIEQLCFVELLEV